MLTLNPSKSLKWVVPINFVVDRDIRMCKVLFTYLKVRPNCSYYICIKGEYMNFWWFYKKKYYNFFGLLHPMNLIFVPKCISLNTLPSGILTSSMSFPFVRYIHQLPHLPVVATFTSCCHFQLLPLSVVVTFTRACACAVNSTPKCANKFFMPTSLPSLKSSTAGLAISSTRQT